MGTHYQSRKYQGRMIERVGVWEIVTCATCRSIETVSGIMTRHTRRQFLRLAASAAALPFAPYIACAQAYPSRPVRIIVGATAGGTTDVAARLIGQWLSERLNQQFVVEYPPGAGTNLGAEAGV